MVANSAVLIVGLSGCDLISMWVVACVCGLTMDALGVGLPIFLPVCVHEAIWVSCIVEWSE